MSVDIKFVPLTFINSNDEILKQIKNTIYFSNLFNEFKETTLSHYLESTQYGYTASANPKGTHQLLRITDINNGNVNWETVPFCNCDSEAKYLLKDNDIVIARTGGTTGKSFIATNVPSNAIFASYLIRLRLKKDVNIDFINGFLNSYIFWSQIVEMKSGSAMPNVNAEKLKTLRIPNCGVDTQNKIANYINNDQNISLNSYVKNKVTHVEEVFKKGNNITSELFNQLSLVKKLRQQLLHDSIQGKLVKQDPNDEPANILLERLKAEKERLIKQKKLKKEKELLPIKPEELSFEIPKNWSWCKMGEVSEIKRGKGPVYSEKGIFKMLNQKCVRWYVVDSQYSKAIDEDWFNSLSEDYTVKTDDILVNSTGDGTIGRSAIADNKVDGYVFDSHILKIRSNINQKYICYFINSEHGQDLVQSVKGATSTKQTELGVNNLINFIIPLPPLSEQHRIVLQLEQLMQTCDALEASIKQSQQQNEQLLQQVLREALTEQLIEPVNVELKSDDKHKALLLGAEIIWQLNQKQTLGHIKLQKLIYLCNRTQKMNLPVNFLKWAMGPYDPELQKYIDTTLVENEWFKYDEDSSLKYQPLKRAGGHKEDFDKYFASDKTAINHLIQLFENAKSARIEIVATLFHCWDELIVKKQLVNDNSLLAEFYKWSEKKKKHTTEKVIDALRWMETQGIVPN